MQLASNIPPKMNGAVALLVGIQMAREVFADADASLSRRDAAAHDLIRFGSDKDRDGAERYLAERIARGE